MKRILTLLLCTVFSINAFAQTIWKDTVFYGGFPKDNSVHELYDTIFNNTSSTFTLTWSKSTSTPSLPSGWTGVGICDAATGNPGTCYGFNDASTHSIDIPAGGKATLDVQMKAAPTADDGPAYVVLTTNLGNITFKYQAWPTSTRDLDQNNLVVIYPNPASDFVNISLKDKRISQVNVVNVIGRRIARFTIDDAARYDDLRLPLDKVTNGVYLLQFADAHGKVLGVRRVTKQ